MERELLKIHDYKGIGEVKIDNDVIAVIAAIATMQVDGVRGMAGTTTQDFVEKISKKNLKKGIKVITEENNIKLTISVIVKSAANIMDLSEQIGEKVETAIETMTGLKVLELNVNVEGVDIDI